MKRDRKRRAYLRAAIQLIFFLLAPAMFTTAFGSIKISSQRSEPDRCWS